jgi:hypothetical protein
VTTLHLSGYQVIIQNEKSPSGHAPDPRRLPAMTQTPSGTRTFVQII